MRQRLYILLTLALASQARAEILTVEGSFSIVEYETSYRVSLSPRGDYEAHPRVTGYVVATITFDTETLKVIEFRIREGSNFALSSFGFDICSYVESTDIGTFGTNITMYFNDLKSEVSGNNGFVRVNPATGEMIRAT